MMMMMLPERKDSAPWRNIQYSFFLVTDTSLAYPLPVMVSLHCHNEPELNCVFVTTCLIIRCFLTVIIVTSPSSYLFQQPTANSQQEGKKIIELPKRSAALGNPSCLQNNNVAMFIVPSVLPRVPLFSIMPRLHVLLVQVELAHAQEHAPPTPTPTSPNPACPSPWWRSYLWLVLARLTCTEIRSRSISVQVRRASTNQR